MFHVAAETEAGFVPTLLLQRVTGVKNPSGGGEEMGKVLVALKTPVLVSPTSCSSVGFGELLIQVQ